MKKALISPNEEVLNYKGDFCGSRVAQVVEEHEVFEVGEPLFWVDCEDDVVADGHYYFGKVIFELPKPPQPEITAAAPPEANTIGSGGPTIVA